MHVIVLTDAEVHCSQKLTDAWEGIEKGGGGGGGGELMGGAGLWADGRGT